MTGSNIQLNAYQQFKVIARNFSNEMAISEFNQCINYSELYKKAEERAAKLQIFGVKSGDRCVVCLPNSINAAITILAIWKTRAIPVLINDQSPKIHLQHAVTQTQCTLFFTTDATRDVATHLDCTIITDEELVQDKGGSSVDIKAKDCPTPSSESAPDPASVIFTSGSTGLPKGVMQSHSTLVNCSKNIAAFLELKSYDNILCPVPWSFDYGFGQLLSTLLVGIPQTLPKSNNPFDVCNAIEQHQPTVVAGVPSLFANIVLGVSPIEETNVDSVRLVTTTGSPISLKVLRLLRKYFTNARFSLNYGLTETYRSTSLPNDMAHTNPGCVGYAVPGVDITILRDDGSEAATGEIGEVVHHGSGVFMGYWGKLEDTQKVRKLSCLMTLREASDQYAMHTGDLGYKDEQGRLYIQGRRDRQIKSMGVRVSPDEIETCLRQHPKIGDAAIITSNNTIYGEIITAVIEVSRVIKINDIALKRSIRLYCKEHLSNYMIPRNFVFTHDLPRTISGKIDYQRVTHLSISTET